MAPSQAHCLPAGELVAEAVIGEEPVVHFFRPAILDVCVEGCEGLILRSGLLQLLQGDH